MNLKSKEEALEAIRIAAYFYKRLKKPLVRATDISSSVDRILQYEVQVVTYRVLGYLLLGIARIYSKKVDYLLNDCQEVLLSINNFVVHTKEDLIAETQKAPYFSITLPECFELDAFDLEAFDDGIEGNVVPIEQITLKDSILGNASTEQHNLHKCLFEDVVGSYYPCSANYSPFEDILSSYGIDVSLSRLLNIDGLTTTLETMQEETFSQRECSDFMASKADEEPPRNSDKSVDEDHRDNTEKINYPEVVKECPIEVCQVIEEDCNTSNFEAETEKLRSDVCYGVKKLIDHDMLCGSTEPQETVHSFIEDENLKNREINEIIGEENPISSKPDKATDIEIPDSSRSFTPRFMAISTPAPKERSRIRKKRKCVFDETIVLPKEVMKRSINDASDLIFRRRKVARTAFAVWRASRAFPRDFLYPSLFTGLSPELRSIYFGKKMEIMKCPKTVERPEALEIPRITISDILEKMDVAPETPIHNSHVILERINIAPVTPVQISAGISEQRDIAPDTPVRNSTTAKPFECPMSPQTPNSESTMISSFECSGQYFSPCRDELLDLTGFDEVKSSLSEDTNESCGGWSGRTRMVAKFLDTHFLSRNKQAEADMLNLSRIVEGRTRKESARIFYEVLVLSSKGCLDVKQDCGYRDILVHKLQKFDQTCGADYM